MHGKLPFPEGTAITEILMTGERGGQQAKVLVGAMGAGFLFDLSALTFGAWRDTFTTAKIALLDPLTEKVKAIFALSTSAAVLGLGYIIGVRYASIICAGSFLSYFVLVPLVAWLGARIPTPVGEGLPTIAAIALIVELLGISALAFALGMYLPIELNTPLLFGALVAEYVRRRSPDEPLRKARNNRGTLIASGLIAGGALAGVFDGVLRMVADWRSFSLLSLDNLGSGGNWLGLGMFCLLSGFVIWNANRARPEEGAGPEISM